MNSYESTSERRMYDTENAVFSPEGRIEYAYSASNQSNILLGIRYRDGIFLAAKRRTRDSVNDSPKSRFSKVSKNIICAASGLRADANLLENHARQEALRHRLLRNREIPCTRLVRRICEVMQSHTQHRTLRPFGVRLLFAGYNKDEGFQLFTCEPSGTYVLRNAICYGQGEYEGQRELQKLYAEGMEYNEVCDVAMRALPRTIDGIPNVKEIEIVVMKESSEGAQIDFLAEDDIDRLFQATMQVESNYRNNDKDNYNAI